MTDEEMEITIKDLKRRIERLERHYCAKCGKQNSNLSGINCDITPCIIRSSWTKQDLADLAPYLKNKSK